MVPGMALLDEFLLEPRAEIDWPPGDNENDTIIGDRHFSLETLKEFNYSIYDNGTVSNGSKCYLTFGHYAPVDLLDNGTWVNASACYTSTDHIGARGYTGIGFAVAFGVSLVLVLVCLAKHGRHYLPHEKRFYPIGRRWQWYWAAFVCACSLPGLFMNIDVDRFRVQGLPIIVTSFFWYLMCMGTTALTWEAVRHWGSWLERQYIDPNPFIYSEDDKRAKIEFYLPLWFYFLVWMNFFMVIPRGWSFAEKQRSPEQEAAVAVPNATGPRFKAGAFFLFFAWLTICYSLRHSIKYYKPRHRGLFNRVVGFVQNTPLRFVLILPLCLAMIAYQALISFDFKYSVIKADGPVPIIYGWGYGSQVLVILVQILYGYRTPNEDKELMRQRRVRGEALDAELGIVRKPAWWRRVKGEHIVGSVRDRIMANVNELGRPKGVGRRAEGDMERDIRETMQADARNDVDDIELPRYPNREGQQREGGSVADTDTLVDGASVRSPNPRRESTLGSNQESDRMLRMASSLLFPDGEEVARREREAEEQRRQRLAYISEDPPPPQYSPRRGRDSAGGARPRTGERSNSTETTNSITSPPAQIKSMLDP